jgi:hypothetical protein
MYRRTTAPFLVATTLALALTLAGSALGEEATPDSAAPAPAWDQEKVTAFANQLAEAADKLRREIQKQRSQSQVGSGQAHAMLQFRDNIRVARNESRHLARALGEGRNRDETAPVYRRLMTLVRDARDTGRRLMIKSPATEFIAEANTALDGLAPYYPEIRPST